MRAVCDRRHEVCSRPLLNIVVKRYAVHGINATRRHHVDAIGWSLQQASELTGPDNVVGMRVEGDHDCSLLLRMCMVSKLSEQGLMSDMHAVEDTNGDDCRTAFKDW